MLGSLARRLRIIGYDAAYASDGDDDQLLAQAVSESRLLITRDRDLASRMGHDAVLLKVTDVEKQVEEVLARTGRPTGPPLSLCTTCNGMLQIVEKQAARPFVPETSIIVNDRFWRCLACGKVYWIGHHHRGISRIVSQHLHRGYL